MWHILYLLPQRSISSAPFLKKTRISLKPDKTFKTEREKRGRVGGGVVVSLRLRSMSARVITVSQDGNGDYRTVQEAIDTVPLCNTCRTIIRLSPGVYKQPVYVPKTKNLITLAGLRPELTVLTWNNTATKIQHHEVK